MEEGWVDARPVGVVFWQPAIKSKTAKAVKKKTDLLNSSNLESFNKSVPFVSNPSPLFLKQGTDAVEHAVGKVLQRRFRRA